MSTDNLDTDVVNTKIQQVNVEKMKLQPRSTELMTIIKYTSEISKACVGFAVLAHTFWQNFGVVYEVIL